MLQLCRECSRLACFAQSSKLELERQARPLQSTLYIVQHGCCQLILVGRDFPSSVCCNMIILQSRKGTFEPAENSSSDLTITKHSIAGVKLSGPPGLPKRSSSSTVDIVHCATWMLSVDLGWTRLPFQCMLQHDHPAKQEGHL